MKVIVTGIAGATGKLVARLLSDTGHEVVGIDRRGWSDAPDGIECIQADIRKRKAENVFRTFRPDAVIHMATVTHLRLTSEARFRINLQGTRMVFRHASHYGAKQAIFVGRHTYYGATPDSPLYHTEDSPPMAVRSFPELSDLVAADLYAGTALWRYPQMKTCVLRLCYTLGPSRHGTLAAFLRGKFVPTVVGYDPLFQFLHEEDHAGTICAALKHKLNGVYNVAGPGVLPLSVLIRETGRTSVPLPSAMIRHAFGRFGLPRLPPGAKEHLKYPVVIDGRKYARDTQYTFKHSVERTIRDFRDA